MLWIELRSSCFQMLTYVPQIQNKPLKIWKDVPPHSHRQKCLFQTTKASVTYPIHKRSKNKLHEALTFCLKTSGASNGLWWATHTHTHTHTTHTHTCAHMQTWVQRCHSAALSATQILSKHHKNIHVQRIYYTPSRPSRPQSMVGSLRQVMSQTLGCWTWKKLHFHV